jgi:hypothetical protein
MSEGKKSAKEASWGGAVGVLVGAGAAILNRKYGVALPPDIQDAVAGLIVGAASGLGAILSSYILGNRRTPDQPHEGPGTSDSLTDARK